MRYRKHATFSQTKQIIIISGKAKLLQKNPRKPCVGLRDKRKKACYESHIEFALGDGVQLLAPLERKRKVHSNPDKIVHIQVKKLK